MGLNRFIKLLNHLFSIGFFISSQHIDASSHIHHRQRPLGFIAGVFSLSIVVKFIHQNRPSSSLLSSTRHCCRSVGQSLVSSSFSFTMIYPLLSLVFFFFASLCYSFRFFIQYVAFKLWLSDTRIAFGCYLPLLLCVSLPHSYNLILTQTPYNHQISTSLFLLISLFFCFGHHPSHSFQKHSVLLYISSLARLTY